MEKPWSQSAARVVSEYHSDALRGLRASDARARLKRHGANVLIQRGGPGALEIFFRQLKSPLMLILFLAVGLALWQGEPADALAIGVVIALNSLIGWIQEYRAEQTIGKLRAILSPQARVIRDNTEQKISARLLVPGDVVVLEAGDRVPADLRLLQARNLRINQATLTGESVPAHKAEGLLAPATDLLGRTNMAFASTLVTAGQGLGVVTATGMGTELGQITSEVNTLQDPPQTLVRQINDLGRLLIVLSIILAVITLMIGVIGTIDFGAMLRVAVSLLVSMVPEGLPVVVTVVLSVGLLRLFRRQALVRRLSAAETLGETTVICLDKTGTLTEGSMMVEKLYVAGTEYRIDGRGYGLSGHFFAGGEKVDITKRRPARLMLELTSLATMAAISKHDLENDHARELTDPTETALAVAAAKAGFYAFKQEAEHPEYLEIPFDQEKRLSASVHLYGNANRVITKGAAEKIIELSTHILGENERVHRLLADTKSKLEATAAEYARAGYRVVAIGYRDQASSVPVDETKISQLTFTGFLCLTDPIRSDAREIISQAARAGVRTVMITGDHLLTAEAIAHRIGLDGGKIVHAADIKHADLGQVQVIARSSPRDKLAIVKRLQLNGEVVAMTGDGVNDAPALKQADIGIAMGRAGTDVAIEAADMVLLNDHFAGVVAAIGEGRLIWENLRKVAFYLVSTSLAEALVIIISLLLGLPLPIIAIQILWMNLATDGVTSLALTAEGPEDNLMKVGPRPQGRRLLTISDFYRMLVLSATMTVGTLWLFTAQLDRGIAYAQTTALTAMVFFQLFNILNSRSATASVFRPHGRNALLTICLLVAVSLQLLAIYHPVAHEYLHTTSLDRATLSQTILVSLSIILVSEAYKLIVRSTVAWAKTVR